MVDATAGTAAGQAANASQRTEADADPVPAIVSRYGLDSFEVDGFARVTWEPTTTVSERCNVRLARREIPFLDGAQLDETGLAPKVIETSIVFINDAHLTIPELGAEPRMYPDRFRALLAMFESRKTGTLNIYGRRNLRMKAASWTAEEPDDKLDYATIRVTFEADNEGKLDAQAAEFVAVAANLQSVADEARFSAQAEGVDLAEFFTSLNTACSQLETALRTPETLRSDVRTKANAVRYNASRIVDAINTNKPGRDKGKDPSGSRINRSLFQLILLSYLAESEARSRDTRVKVIRLGQLTSVWQLAARLGVTGDELIALNPGIGDPNAIEPGTPITVPE